MEENISKKILQSNPFRATVAVTFLFRDTNHGNSSSNIEISEIRSALKNARQYLNNSKTFALRLLSCFSSLRGRKKVEQEDIYVKLRFKISTQKMSKL